MNSANNKVNIGKWVILAIVVITILGLMAYVHSATQKTTDPAAVGAQK